MLRLQLVKELEDKLQVAVKLGKRDNAEHLKIEHHRQAHLRTCIEESKGD